MGLMLSVLVFCVGVIEVLDCWHHLLHHLNPLRPLLRPQAHSSRSPVLELKGPPPDSWRPSNVDISWPKDLSPSDDLHVIRRRQNSRHSESEQNEHEREADKSSGPQIVIHTASREDENHESPPVSRESSPNHLELSVIVESDSSSEMDEPTQIENLAYKKKIEALNSGIILNTKGGSPVKERVADTPDVENVISKGTSESSSQLSHEETLIPKQSVLPSSNECFLPETLHTLNNKSPINYPLTFLKTNANEDGEFKDIAEELTSIAQHSCEYKDSPTYNFTKRTLDCEVCKNGNCQDQFNLGTAPDNLDTDSFSDLPVFTDSILSDNVTKVTCHYPSGRSYLTEDTSLPGTAPASGQLSPSTNLSNIQTTDLEVGSVASSENIPANNTETNVQIEKACEVPENIPECPDIRLSESSPILREESSDSSLNTSDASWLVKSKMSENPIDEKEASNTPENVAEMFMSVTKVDLQLFAKDKTDKQMMREEQGHAKIALEENLSNIETEDNIISVTLSNYCTTVQTNLAEVNIDNLDLENCKRDQDSKPSSSLRHSSSNSSLSEIPQLPEDTTDISSAALPTDNGLGDEPNTNESLHAEYDSLSEYLVQSLPTDASSFSTGQRHNVSLEEVPGSTARNERTKETDKVGFDKITCSAGTDISSQPTMNIDGNDFNAVLNNKSNSDLQISAQSQALSLGNEVLSESKSSGDSNPAVLCKAKESDQKDHADKRAEAVSVRTSEPRDMCDVQADPSEPQPQPSTPTAPDEAVASTSTSTSTSAPHENKAFWLIFSGEYTKAMNKDWHSGHFCCWQCDESLTGQRYVLRDEHPYCIKCYESVFANGCEECSKTIGIDSKDLSYKDKHWHEACFLCNKCRVSLVDKQFGSKLEKIFCGNCYDAQFASRCDGCGQIFKAGQ